jgi:EF-hand domain
MYEEIKMQKRILMLAMSGFILACGATAATAQQPPMMQQQAQTQQPQQERPVQGTQSPGRSLEEDDTAITGWHHGPGWSRYREHMGIGMMRGGGMMGPGGGMMMRLLFAMMDSDGDGTVSLQEFHAAHERIFKAMDANKDGVLTQEEIQSFLQGTRTPLQGTLAGPGTDLRPAMYSPRCFSIH